MRKSWGKNLESVSGPGSIFSETEEIRKIIPFILNKYNIKSIIDIPCGDFNWMQHVNLDDHSYIGGDIVSHMIEKLRDNYSKFGKKFIVLDICKDEIPEADLLLCRDCFIHLSFGDAKKALSNIKKSKIKYVLITTNPNINENRPIITGEFRNVNLQMPPYNFPMPIEIHRDRHTQVPEEELIDPHKMIGLWRVMDLP